MAGRPRKIIQMHVGAHTKAEKKSRIRQEQELKIDRNGLVPPAWLSSDAAKEFNRVVAETGKAGILDNLDLSILAIYADSFAEYTILAEQIKDEGPVIEVTGTKGQTYKKVNPALVAQNMYVERIYKASAKLGMATTDRLKLVVPVKKEKEEKNRYFKYLDADG